METKPYVGITGPVSKQEVENIIQEFVSVGYSMQTPHIPMLGYLVSYKTLNGTPTTNRRYPLFNDLRSLLEQANNRVLTMVHYNSKEHTTLADQVGKIFNGIYEDNLCRAMQLNMVWPDKEQVALIKNKYPELKIVFQANGPVMKDRSHQEFVDEIKKYGTSIDYVLIDPSGGSGKGLDIEDTMSRSLSLKRETPYLTVGFAGGFSGVTLRNSLKALIGLAGRDTNFCIDAESGLRDKLSAEYGDDLLNMGKVKDYLRVAAHYLK